MSDNPQAAVFAFLADPATHGGAKVRQIDTHGAAVFLAGDRVLKVKRAVRFPFLDYSTLEKRKAACEAEIEVNKPFAPKIYHGVAVITDEGGHLAIGGKGKPVEYAVDMLRFDEDSTLDHLAAAGRIDAALADALGRAVAAAHAKAPVADAPAWIDALGLYIEQNDEAFAKWPDLFEGDKITGLTKASRAAHKRLIQLLTERGHQGLIRRGHGDLHLGNIALIDGKPMLFDAIEFDPLIASGDVFYDLAFLLMDLIERDLPGPANIVLNRYLAETRRDGDLDALAALPLFLSVRAAIRSKVTAAKLDQGHDDQKAEITRSAKAYFDWACRLIAPAAPTLVAVGGLSGTGKSVLARGIAPAIAPPPGAVVLRSDVQRKVMFGKAETEKLPPEAYTREAGDRVYAALAEKARRVLKAGHSAVVDAVFAREAERAGLREVARSLGVPLQGLFLTADLATRVARIGKRVGDASDADATVAQQQESYDLGSLDWTDVDASGTPEQTLANATQVLKGSTT